MALTDFPSPTERFGPVTSMRVTSQHRRGAARPGLLPEDLEHGRLSRSLSQWSLTLFGTPLELPGLRGSRFPEAWRSRLWGYRWILHGLPGALHLVPSGQTRRVYSCLSCCLCGSRHRRASQSLRLSWNLLSCAGLKDYAPLAWAASKGPDVKQVRDTPCGG